VRPSTLSAASSSASISSHTSHGPTAPPTSIEAAAEAFETNFDGGVGGSNIHSGLDALHSAAISAEEEAVRVFCVFVFCVFVVCGCLCGFWGSARFQPKTMCMKILQAKLAQADLMLQEELAALHDQELEIYVRF
jgi:hypothetical protein